MDIQAYSDNRLQVCDERLIVSRVLALQEQASLTPSLPLCLKSKVVDLLLRNQAGDKIWREKDGRGDKAFFLALSHHQVRASQRKPWSVCSTRVHLCD